MEKQIAAEADPLEAVCAAFASRSAGLDLPSGCTLRLEAERLNDGRIGIRIVGADPAEIIWPRDGVRLASAVYRPGKGSRVDPMAAFAAFAGKLDGMAGQQAKSMGMAEGLRAFCAYAVREAAGIPEPPVEEERRQRSFTTTAEALDAVRQDGLHLQDLPNEVKTMDVCRAAVRQNGRALKFVPLQLRGPEMCLAAIRQDSYAARYVPKHLQAGIRAWVKTGKGLEKPPYALPAGPASPLKVADAVFAESVAGLGLPRGCSLRLEASSTLVNGRRFAALRITASDEAGIAWHKNGTKLFFSLVRGEFCTWDGLPKALSSFASRLGTADSLSRHEKEIPDHLRKNCSFALECAAEAVSLVCSWLNRQEHAEEREEEAEGPRPG